MRTLITAIALLLQFTLLAQPSIDRLGFATYAPVYGYHDVPYLPAGKPGSGMKWDFSALPQGAIVPYRWTTTDIAPGAGAFPVKAQVLQVPGEPRIWCCPAM